MTDYVAALRKAHRKLRDRDGVGPEEAFARLVSWLDNGGDNTVLAPLERLRGDRGHNDVAAVALRTFIAGDLRKGLGLYLTPDAVADRLVASLGPLDGQRVLDPACGTGGLLLAVARRGDQPAQITGIDRHGGVLAAARWSLETRFGERLALHRTDALRDDEDASWQDPGTWDAIVCNPPFGVAVARNEVSSPIADLVADNRGGGVAAEWLFIERAIRWLKPRGRAAFIVPNGVLSNVRDKAARAWIAARAETVAIDALPEDAFVHAGARVGTSIWTLERRTAENPVISADCETPGTSHEGRRLGDLCLDIRTGRTPSKPVYGDEGTFIIKVGNLTGRGMDWYPNPRNFVDPTWPEKLGRGRFGALLTVREGDILLTSTAHARRYIAAKVDRVAFIPDHYGTELPFVGELLRLRPDPTRIDPRYLLAWLRSPTARAAIQALARGQSAHLRPRDIAELRVPQAPDNQAMNDLLAAIDAAEAAQRAQWEANRRVESLAATALYEPSA